MGFYVHFSHWMIEDKKMNGIKPMADCEECGKNLGIFEGYRHPTLGKKHLVCWDCHEQVEESVAVWRQFIVDHKDIEKPMVECVPDCVSSYFPSIKKMIA